MKIRIFQKGFHYGQDGRGNRLVLHLQGCNLRCPWCSNPEGLEPEGVLLTDKAWLSECCCPHGAVTKEGLDRNRCLSCRTRDCVRTMRQKGIRLSYREYETEEILRECERSKPMFFDGGGVTLTGGEVSVQLDAVKELLQGLKARSIHTAIETNGLHPRLPELVPLVDQWIMDIKHYDASVHQSWCGAGNEAAAKVLEHVSAHHPDVTVRVPLIPGFNDREQDAEGFAAYFLEHIRGGGTRIEFLTYHEFGKTKWEQCGLTYFLPSRKIAPETVQTFEKIMKENGLLCVRT